MSVRPIAGGDNDPWPRWPFLGLAINSMGRTDFLERFAAALDGGERLRISFLNPYYAQEALEDERLSSIMNWFDILQPDGWGVVYAARLCGIPTRERVAIEDIEMEFFELLRRRHRSVFLFGSEPGVADQAAAVLGDRFPGIEVAGTLHGWLDVESGTPGRFSRADHDRSVAAANDSGADVVLVGLPTPLQQEWVWANRHRLDAPIVMTVGAYLDKLAERLDWYPGWIDAARLGWAYRTYREPVRMIPRYGRLAVRYGQAVVKERARRRATVRAAQL